MHERFSYREKAPAAYEAMSKLQAHVNGAGLEPRLGELVKLRVSMLNSCAFCVDMHFKQAKRLGEPDERLYGLSALADAPFYTERERAALHFAEAVTRIERGVPDAIFEAARAHFSETELVELTLLVVAINGWNRLSVTFRTPPAGQRSARG